MRFPIGIGLIQFGAFIYHINYLSNMDIDACGELQGYSIYLAMFGIIVSFMMIFMGSPIFFFVLIYSISYFGTRIYRCEHSLSVIYNALGFICATYFTCM